MKVNLLYYALIQMMYILYFTYITVCSPTSSSVSHCVSHSVFQCLSLYTILALILIIIIFVIIRMYLLTNVFTKLMQQAISLFSFHVLSIQVRMRN